MGKEGWMYVLEAIIWYVFLAYFLFSITIGTRIWIDALVLLVLAYLGTLACPWTWKFKKLFKESKKR